MQYIPCFFVFAMNDFAHCAFYCTFILFLYLYNLLINLVILFICIIYQ